MTFHCFLPFFFTIDATVWSICGTLELSCFMQLFNRSAITARTVRTLAQ